MENYLFRVNKYQMLEFDKESFLSSDNFQVLIKST